MSGRRLLALGRTLAEVHKWSTAIPLLEKGIAAADGDGIVDSDITTEEMDAGMYVLARSYAETNKFDLARRWTDALYANGRVAMAEPAYHLCRRLRETGQTSLAFYYYLVAQSFSQPSDPPPPHPLIPVEPGLHDYLLDYEKSILWSYVGAVSERHSRLHGLAHSMRLLEKAELPHYIRQSIVSNLQYYAPPLQGDPQILRAEKSVEEAWRYSTPTFVDQDTTLIRVVYFSVADDGGTRHVPPKAGDRVTTKLVLSDTDEEFNVRLSPGLKNHAAADDHRLHPDANILGLEDTRVVRDATNGNTIFTLSAAEQYSEDGSVIHEVLVGVLDIAQKTHTLENVIRGPHPDRLDENWVFAGGIDHVVYDWYPDITIGAIDRDNAVLRVHTTIPSPRSFDGMQGSTNGAKYKDEWWFVTHVVIYRTEQRRKHLHRLVVLNTDLTAIVRHSLPFTFEADSDVEYCSGLRLDDSGLELGYSVRDRSSKIMRVAWRDVGQLF